METQKGYALEEVTLLCNGEVIGKGLSRIIKISDVQSVGRPAFYSDIWEYSVDMKMEVMVTEVHPVVAYIKKSIRRIKRWVLGK